MHETSPISLEQLKCLANASISDYVLTASDFSEMEIVFLKMINFDLRARKLGIILLEDFFSQLRSTSRVGKKVSFQTCSDVFTLLYENPRFICGQASERLTAIAVLVSAYLLSVPKDECTFPLLAWASQVSKHPQDEVRNFTHKILSWVLSERTSTSTCV